ncbi:ureidoglycolate dehydrogenase [Staphylococcus sp. 17KM0847]|uniref:ureidoglycolate dehydrogenase n=1 Tax=Staphylococcus sp. 17KM0847 TaxID=2583989 RepID=UPI0015DCD1BE|nr:ureidoglycolate dehydrogenase [Staphylococcus sp. 17KM0847]QLK85377.1 ureidoglycolate dehydrogenase [Staphylococcus sp. 17KM0847]
MDDALVYVNRDELRALFLKLLIHSGLPEKYAEKTADLMIFADERGIHSHGSVRAEYYANRIKAKGYNLNPKLTFERTSPCTGLYHGDNAVGHYVAYKAMEEAIAMAKENGVAIVGVKEMGHSGAIGYFAKQAALEGMVALTVCQSDPMVVPFGGTKPYFGTNPIAFATPRKEGEPIVFDMATTVQAWGKILDARSKGKDIPETWAVDSEGNPTTNPHNVAALLPIAGPKGYGLMMMIDILAGTLLGLPFGQHVTSMYKDLSEYRRLGQLHIVINPAFFGDRDAFLAQVAQMVEELHAITPAQGFDQVYYPGEIQETVVKKYQETGIPVAREIYDYLLSKAE